MKKGLIIISFVFVAMILCVSNVQATTGSSCSLESFVADIGTTDFHSISIIPSNELIMERVLLTKRPSGKKPKKKKMVDTGDDDLEKGMLIAKRHPKKPKKKK